MAPQLEVVPIADQPDESQVPTREQIETELASELLRIHEESYGRGAQIAKALLGEDWVVVMLDDLELLPNEKFLVESGDAEAVAQMRARYQQAIQSSFRAAVERATGRTVVGFLSATNVEEPRFVAEIFKLA